MNAQMCEVLIRLIAVGGCLLTLFGIVIGLLRQIGAE